jgi:PAS domain S-box-containing protein
MSSKTKPPEDQMDRKTLELRNQVAVLEAEVVRLKQAESERRFREQDITERKRAEEALQMFQFCIEQAADAVFWLDQDGRYTYVNEEACRSLGYTRDELMRMHLWDVDPVFPRERYDKEWAQFQKGELGRQRIETWHRRKDGVIFPVEVSYWQTWLGNTELHVAYVRDITERKRTEEALRQSEERFRALVENSADGIVLIGAQGTITYASPATTRILGYTIDEYVGRNGFELVHPDEAERLAGILAEMLQKPGYPVTVQYRLRHKDGSWRWIEGVGTNLLAEPSVRAIVANYRDITDRKQIEEALLENEDKYRQLFELESDAIVLIENETGQIIEANTAASALYGYTYEDLLGKKNSDLSAEPEETRRVTETTPVVADRVVFVPLRFHRKKDGTVFPVEITGRFFVWRGRSVHIAAIRDITERKRAEAERLELERRLLHTQKLESLGVLAGGIAHDFNNLLTAILGNLDLALSSLSPDSRVRPGLEQALQASYRAADLTRQMLAYSGKGRFVVRNIDLSALVEENAQLFGASIAKMARLKLDLARNLPAIVADPGQMQQVIMNLLTNASEALGEQGGVIALTTDVQACDEAYLSQSRLEEKPSAGRFVYVEVSDTGCGMDEETQQRLFDPFFTTKFIGRGLGMAAVLGIVRGHTGAILMDSEVGQGTTIRVLFPVSETGRTAVANAHETTDTRLETMARSSLAGTVLVVDDEEMVRDLCRAIVEQVGFQALTAADGREALEIFHDHAAEIVCVILDLTMPWMDGVAAFRELRRIRPEVKVILASGYNEQEATQRFAGQGLAGFIQKPYRLQDLRDKLAGALKSSG